MLVSKSRLLSVPLVEEICIPNIPNLKIGYHQYVLFLFKFPVERRFMNYAKLINFYSPTSFNNLQIKANLSNRRHTNNFFVQLELIVFSDIYGNSVRDQYEINN